MLGQWRWPVPFQAFEPLASLQRLPEVHTKMSMSTLLGCNVHPKGASASFISYLTVGYVGQNSRALPRVGQVCKRLASPKRSMYQCLTTRATHRATCHSLVDCCPSPRWPLFLSRGRTWGPRSFAVPKRDTARMSAATAIQIAGHRDPPAVEDRLLQYVVLRRDLWEIERWPLGSIVAQACHASTAALWLSRDHPETVSYCSEANLENMHKVVLEIKGTEQLQNLSKALEEANICHKLWTEQPENIPTSLATAPNRKSKLQPFFKKLKLCKGTSG